MKILHVIPSVSAAHGGPSIALETMTRALAEAGVSVDVVTTDDDGLGRLNVPLGTPVLKQGVKYWFFARQTQFYRFSLPLTRWLARNITQYNLVHLHALFSYTSIPGSLFAARAHVPYIVRPLGTLNQYGMTHHHPTFKRVSYSLIERHILTHASYVHYTSDLERDEAQALGVSAPAAVIPLGIDVSMFEGDMNRTWLETYAPQFRDRVVFLFLSRLDPKKGIERLLDAFARLGNLPVALVIAGDGEAAYVRSLRAHAHKLHLNDAVLWAGFVAGDEKRALLRAADVFVLPSSSENFGIAIVEAMAAGLPVMVTPEIGIARIIAASDAGLMVSNHVKDWAEAMGTLAQAQDRRHAIGVRGRNLARTQFSLEAMTRGLIELYESAVQEDDHAAQQPNLSERA